MPILGVWRDFGENENVIVMPKDLKGGNKASFLNRHKGWQPLRLNMTDPLCLEELNYVFNCNISGGAKSMESGDKVATFEALILHMEVNRQRNKLPRVALIHTPELLK